MLVVLGALLVRVGVLVARLEQVEVWVVRLVQVGVQVARLVLTVWEGVLSLLRWLVLWLLVS